MSASGDDEWLIDLRILAFITAILLFVILIIKIVENVVALEMTFYFITINFTIFVHFLKAKTLKRSKLKFKT